MKPAIILVLVVLLASCTNDEGPSQLYIGGGGGLVFAFEEGAPPSIIQDESRTPMTMILRLENTGEYDIPKGEFMLSGINANDFPGFSQGPHTFENVEGKALIQSQVVDGTAVFVELGEAVYERRLTSASLDFTMNAKACYPYATSATATVCLASDYYSPQLSCDPHQATIAASAAPITISNIETAPAGSDRLRISFDVSKTGTHQIWAPVPSQVCPNDRQALVEQGDRVYVRIDGANNDVSCTGLPELHDSGFNPTVVLSAPQQFRPNLDEVNADAEGYVRLSGGRARVQCTLTTQGDVDSRGTIDIVAAYFVEDTVSKRFTVERS